MELRYYWRSFKRRAWIPLVLAAAAVITAGLLVVVSKPSYTATATVLAKSSGQSSPAFSFQQAVSSNTVALAVIQKVGLSEPVDALARRVHVVPVSGGLYRISVTDPSAARATAIANALAQEATALFLQLNTTRANATGDQVLTRAADQLRQEYVAAATERVKFSIQHPNAISSKDVGVVIQALQLQIAEDVAASAYRGALDQQSRNRILGLEAASNYDARVVDQAIATPDTGGRIIEILSAAVLALVLGVALIFLLEYLDNAVREPEVAEAIVGAPVIGIIPRASPHSLRTARGGA